MKHRYVLGAVRQRLGELDRQIHRAYAADPNRDAGTVHLGNELRELAGRLVEVADVLAPLPPLMRSVPVNPNDPLGPRMLNPAVTWGEMSPAARAKLFDPVENARVAKHLYDRQVAEKGLSPWFGTVVDSQRSMEELAAVMPSLSVGTYGGVYSIERRPVPWWNLYWRVRLWWTARHDDEEE